MEIKFCVEDTGIGIEEDVLAKLFQPVLSSRLLDSEDGLVGPALDW